MAGDERLSGRLEARLEYLYSRGEAAELLPQVLELAAHEADIPAGSKRSFNGNGDGRLFNKWDQSDVFLITYGDTFFRDNQTGLQVLNRFLHRHLMGVVSGVHILPFFPATSDGGFAVSDYSMVRPDLGDWGEVRSIAADFEVMSDLVINHVSSGSEWFKNYLAGEGTGSDFFIEAEPDADLSLVVRPRSLPLLSPAETSRGRRFVWTTFSADQVDLDFSNPKVLLEFLKIIRLYLDNGIRVLRLDAVAFLWKEQGTSCIHLPQTHEIIRLLRDFCEAINPAAIILTETNVPNIENISYFGNRDEAHWVYNFSLPPLMLHTLFTGRSTEIRNWLMGMPPAPLGCTYFNFLASHDGIGLRPAEGLISEADLDALIAGMRRAGGRISMRSAGGVDKPYEMNITWFDACRYDHSGGGEELQVERFLCAHTVMLGLEGVPGIYVHSFLASPNDLAGVNTSGENRAINRASRDLDELEKELADQSSPPARVLQELSRLLHIRREQKAFHPNATQYTLQLGEELLGFWRQSMDRSQSIFAIHNITGREVDFDLLSINLIETEQWIDLLSGNHLPGETIKLAPYQCLWISNSQQ